MKVCAVGLWHQGTVIAGCMAEGGHTVTGLDFDETVIQQLQLGTPPVYEPGLKEIIKRGLETGKLAFTSDAAAVGDAEVVWVTYDTPVDADDKADVDYVIERVKRLFPHLAPNTLVLISSQLPVGTTSAIAADYARAFPSKPVTFAYSPENIRLGRAISVFTMPDRVVAGVRTPADQPRIALLLRPFSDQIEWMSVESAEMTKHAINAFLATSVTFINELAVLCEAVGADAKEVERGLKSECRIGAKAYLAPGGPFAGGTLARDVIFLAKIGVDHQLPTPLFTAIKVSNDTHKLWVQRKLLAIFGTLRDRKIAIWGLTYKPDTDTLRRSSAVELCKWLAQQGATVQAHDPSIRALPEELKAFINLESTPLNAVAKADALIVATEWHEYRAVAPDAVVAVMTVPTVIDANRFLVHSFGRDPLIRYAAVGKADV